MILYPLSSDPFHSGHYNIAQKAESMLGDDVTFMVSMNPLKTEGLLSMEQRVKDLLITVFSYNVRAGKISFDDRVSKFLSIKERVIAAPNKQYITKYMDLSDAIIRGVRTHEDKDYSLKLLKKIGKLEWLEKSHWITQAPAFRQISSTNYKIAYASVKTEIDDFPEVYSFLDKKKIDSILVHQSSQEQAIIEGTKKEIINYFSLVASLEKDGRYTDLNI